MVIVSYPLVTPRNFFDACSASDDLRLEVHCPNDPVDLTCAEQASILRTTTGFAGAGKLAAIIVAILVGNCIATSIIRNAHQNLGRVKLGRPEKIECSINLSDVSVRLDTL